MAKLTSFGKISNIGKIGKIGDIGNIVNIVQIGNLTIFVFSTKFSEDAERIYLAKLI